MEKLQGKNYGNIDIKNNTENLVNTKMMKLGDLLDKESRGARIRAKVEEIEGERSTKYFFSKEHSNGEKKQISALLIENINTSEENDIMKEVKSLITKIDQ